MAGFDYGRMTATASRLMARFAQRSVVLKKTPRGPGPNDWTPGDPTTTEFPLDATVKGVSKQFVDGTTILSTDLEITAAVFGAEPDPADALLIDGKPVTVLQVMRLPAAGTVVAWKWIARG
jgi:hypothetical protein